MFHNTKEVTEVISLLSQDLQLPNCWLGVMYFHVQFTCSFEHVMWNKNVNIFSKSDTAQWWHITPTYQVIFPFDHVVMWYHITKFTLCLHFCKIYKHLDSRISSHMYFWLCRHLMSHDKIKTIFLYFHKMCKCWT